MNTVRSKSWCLSQEVWMTILLVALFLSLGSNPAWALPYEPDAAILAVDPGKQPLVEQTIKTEEKYKHCLSFSAPKVAVLWVGGTRRLTILRYSVKPDHLGEFLQVVKDLNGVLAVQRDYHGEFRGSGQKDEKSPGSNGAASTGSGPKVVNDPFFPSQWHHSAIHSPAAWHKMGGKLGCGIAILDSASFGYHPWVGPASNDKSSFGHGTRVYAIAHEQGFDAKGGIGVSPMNWPPYCQMISYDGVTVTDWHIIEAIATLMEKNGPKIINLSANCEDPNLRYANKNAHPVLHKVFQTYHDQFGGLIFNSAFGGAGPFDPSPLVPYLIVVGGTQKNGAMLGTPGPAVWFLAPAENIWSRGKDGKVTVETGVSYAAPMVAGVASLVWGANLNLSNVQVEQILKETCTPVMGGAGWGMPNAEKAVARAIDLGAVQRSASGRQSN